MTEYAWEFQNNALWDTVLTTLYLDHLALAEQGSTVTTAQTTTADTINNTMSIEETTQVDIADTSTTILTLVIAGCVGGLLFVGVVVTSFVVLCVSNVYPVFGYLMLVFDGIREGPASLDIARHIYMYEGSVLLSIVI